MKRSIDEKKETSAMEPQTNAIRHKDKMMEILRHHWNYKQASIAMVKQTIETMGELLEPGTFDHLMEKHLGTKQCTRAPLRKKQRSDPEIMSNGLPEYMTDDYIAEMKLWKKKEIFAKLEAENVNGFKEGWNRGLLVDHLVETLQQRNAQKEAAVEDNVVAVSRPVPPPSSFQTAPPPRPRGNVARAVARREQKPLLTASKSVHKLKAQVAASKPAKVLKVTKESVEESAKQMLDAAMDDVGEVVESQPEVIDDSQRLMEEFAAKKVAEEEAAKAQLQTPEILASPSKKRPTSPSIPLGLVSSAKKSYFEHLQKTNLSPVKPHAGPVKFPMFNPKPQASKSPRVTDPMEISEAKPSAKNYQEDIHFAPTVKSPVAAVEPDVVASTAPSKEVGSSLHRKALKLASSSKKVSRQSPFKAKKLALAEKMRAQNIEKLPGVSAAQPSSITHQGLSKTLSSKHLKVKTTKEIKPLTGSRLAKSMSLKKKTSSKTLKKPPLPASFESYEMTDTEAYDYDSEDSAGLRELRATKPQPKWVRSKRLVPALDFQLTKSTIDPDALFGRVTTCDLNAIFNRNSPRLQQRRRGSGDWSPIAPIKSSSSQFRHNAATATSGAC